MGSDGEEHTASTLHTTMQQSALDWKQKVQSHNRLDVGGMGTG